MVVKECRAAREVGDHLRLVARELDRHAHARGAAGGLLEQHDALLLGVVRRRPLNVRGATPAVAHERADHDA